MRLKVKTGKIVGQSKEEVWGQVFQTDNFFLVIEVIVPADDKAAPLGKEIIETLVDEFSQLTEINLQNLKNLTNLTGGRISSFQIAERTVVNIIVCALVDSLVYLVIKGQGKAILKRREKIAVLLDGESSGSGQLEDNDLLILASPKFNQIVSLATLKSSLDQHPADEIAENLAPLVHSQENSCGSAGLILKFEKEEEKEGREGREGVREFLRTKVKSLLKRSSFLTRKKIGKEEKSKKTVLTVALILTGLLLMSVVLGYGKREKSLREQKLEPILETVSHQYEESKALLELNTQKARESLKSAQETLTAVREEFPKGSKERRKIEEWLGKVETGLKETEKTYQLTEAPLFFDPVFLKDKAFGDGLALAKEKLVILDKKNQTIYSLKIKEKSGQILAGGEELAGSKLVGIHGDNVYVLAEEGIIELSVISGQLSVMIKKDEEWGELADLVAYRGNLYLLDKKGVIIKYLRTDQGFAKRNYLGPGVEPDFSSASSMTIDGDVWVAIAGKVLKFSLGALKEFSVQGLEQPLGSRLLIYTDEECANVYLLDKENIRIVVLNKDGEYQAQYQWGKIGEANDLVVSEKEKKILVLVEGKIYGIEIKP